MVEVADKATAKHVALCLWAPQKLTWWIAILFMIGSSFFALGCILFLQGFHNAFQNGLVFFIGSIFFTSAAYCQYHQVINKKNGARKWFVWQPNMKGFVAAFTQFIGTLFFNFNTFDALFSLGWIEQELLIWGPNIVGSILFQISGTITMFEIGRCWWSAKNKDLSWWIGFIGFTGCITFMISACLAIVTPHPLDILAQLATIFTLVGAICFFISAYLMIPELSLKPVSVQLESV